MADIPPQSENPYQTPALDVNPLPQLATGTSIVMHKRLRDARSQMVALGAFWIIIGGLALALGGLWAWQVVEAEARTNAGVVMAILGGAGLVWLFLGVATCCKQLWALYSGLALSYLSLLGNLLTMSLCPIVLLIVAIVQAHRIISWVKDLHRHGISITVRPEELQLTFKLPSAAPPPDFSGLG